MKPLSLKLSGFGPFAGEATVDFEKAGENGIFLITGDTGSGKTTIFDGIVFALYGTPGGDDRDVSMIRSSYADPGTPTFAELTFSHEGRTYTVRRNPEYPRPARKGSGMAKEPADATLLMPDGTAIHRIREVDRNILSLLKMDREQFLRISMLVQGSFQKLLFADTSVRQEIFRSLFRTELCQEAQQKLKKDASEAVKQAERLDTEVSGIRQKIRENADSPEEYTEPSDLLSALSARIKLRSGRMDELKKEQGKCRSRMQELLSIQEAGREKKQILGKTASIRAEKAGLEAALASMEKQHAGTGNPEEEAARKEKAAGAIEASLPLLDEYRDLSLENEDTDRKIPEWESGIRQGRDTRGKLVRLISEAEDRLACLEKDSADIPALEAMKKEKRLRKRQAEALLHTMSRLRESRERAASAEYRLETADSEVQRCTEKYQSVFHGFLAAQSALIARDLKDGEPCPVCGSLSHPAPAGTPLETVTGEDVDRTARDLDRAKKEASAAGICAAEAKKEQEMREDEYKKSFSALFPEKEVSWFTGPVSNEIQKMELEAQSAEIRISGEKERLRKKEQLEGLLEDYRQKLSQLDTAVSQRENAVEAASLRKSGNEKRMDKIRQELGYDSREKAISDMESFRREAEAIRESIKKAEREKASVEEKIRKADAEIAVLQARADAIPEQDAGDAEAEYNSLREKEQEHEILELYSRLEKDRELERQLREMPGAEELRSLKERASWMKELAGTACGNLPGKEKVTFETYVQRTYFDRVLSLSDTHMSAITGGRYGLKRASGSSDNRSKSGLDINVADHWNGSERSVRSLSGGEAFLASLSLALGLSGVLRSDAGNISVEAVFIDEGFGSLDSDSLDAVVSALESLAGSGLMVGIVSHVGKLKEHIRNRITVCRPEAGGSSMITEEACPR